MNIKMTLPKVISLSLLVAIFVSGCGIFPQAATSTPTLTPTSLPTNTLPPPTPEPSATFTAIPPTPVPPTPTVTPLPVMMETATPLPTQASSSSGTSRCYGLNGRLEVRAYVPEAAGVGLEPFSIGEIPFSVVTNYVPYRIQGKSKLVYKGKTEEDWGSYKGDINMMGSVTGQCLTGEHDGELRLNVALSGNRLIVVRSRGYNKQFPWSGGNNIPITLFLSEGYTYTTDEWVFVLHKGPGED